MDFLSTRALSFSLKSVLCRNKNLPFKCEVRCLPLPPPLPARVRLPGKPSPTLGAGFGRDPDPSAAPRSLPPWHLGRFLQPLARILLRVCTRAPLRSPARAPPRSLQEELGGGTARWRTLASRTEENGVEPPVRCDSSGGHRADGTTQPRWAPRLRPRPGAHPVASQCTRLAG